MEEMDSLIEGLASDDPKRQLASAERLAGLGEEASPAAIHLVEILSTCDGPTRELSIAALEQLGAPPTGQVEALGRLVCDSFVDRSYWAATLVGRLGEQGAPAVASLVEVLGCPNRFPLANQEKAAWALGQIGAGAAAAVPTLRNVASSHSPRLSRLAAAALDAIGNAG